MNSPDYKRILDNRPGRKVADYLRERLQESDALRVVSAYFSIYGYQQLEGALNGIGNVRFLFGDPGSIDDIDPGKKEAKAFNLTEQGLSPRHTLQQGPIAVRCADWVKRPDVAIRGMKRANFLHGKMYLAAREGRSQAAVVGSSNFTKAGLGGSARPNLEINLATTEAEILAELQRWFDALWHDEKQTEDVKEDVLAALARIGKNHAPEFIYFKTLFELFKDEIDARLEDEASMKAMHLYETEIWKSLYKFQQHGAKDVIRRLLQHNGCILADSVGLGKTWTALAVIKYFELRNQRVLVLCPKKLRGNWSQYSAHAANTDNPFLKDRFGYSLLSHTDLSRERGMSGDIDLENFAWGNFDLIVIDESHNFRNASETRYRADGTPVRRSRYDRLLNQMIKQGAQTKVLMLSATPVNTSLMDLRNQIFLMTEKREDTFRESLNIGSINVMLAQAQKAFKAWEGKPGKSPKRDKLNLIERLGQDFPKLLCGISIARSRRHIKNSYAEDLTRIGQFPKHEKPENHYPATDTEGQLSYEQLSEQIGRFEFSIYRPSQYVVDEDVKRRLREEKERHHFNQETREGFLIQMIRINFLKRLESSAYSLTKTLERTLGKIDELLGKIDRYQSGKSSALAHADVLPENDEDDDEFLINRAREPYHLGQLNLPLWKKKLEQDRTVLRRAYNDVAAIGPERDGKLQFIKERIRAKAQRPPSDINGKTNRKLLVFTTFKDTAEYLHDQLSPLADELKLNIAMVAGDATRTQIGANDFNSILTNFAPVARMRAAESETAEIDLLIATDCISEGQNLQDCDTVLNYDIHWNPVRLIQRFGRVDRIGSRSKSVRMINYWPTKDMEIYLHLQTRVQARMALADVVATGDDDPFEEAGQAVRKELSIRDAQLKLMREEIVDFDELSDSLVLSDFTLDHFFAQLRAYLEKNREELEQTPQGAYALTDTGDAKNAPPGVIFVLRQRNTATDESGKAGAAAGAKPAKNASPLSPFYLAYVRESGAIQYRCAQARQVLEAFEACAKGKSKPLTKLCDAFDRETEQGTDMKEYDNALQQAVRHIIEANTAVQTKGLGAGGGRGFKLPRQGETPQSMGDFSLVSWLIIREGK